MNIVNSYFAINPFGKSDECALFTIDDITMPFTLSEVADVDQEYTLSFWVKSENAGSINIGDRVIQTSTEWFRHVHTFKATSSTVRMYFGIVGSYFVYKAKLELGNTVTDWTPAPEDLETEVEGISIEVSKRVTPDQMDEAIGAIDEFHNTAVDITSDGIKMKTTGSIVAVVDDVERLTIDEEGVSAPLIVADEIRSANLLTRHTSTTAEWKGSIQESIDAIPKYLMDDTTLTIPAGNYEENVLIAGFVGRTLEIIFSNGVTIVGSINIHSCSSISLHANSLGDMSVYPETEINYIVYIRYCQHVHLKNLQISGYRERASADSGTGTGLLITECNSVVESCCIEYTNKNAITFQRGTFFCLDCIGGYMNGDYTTNANLGRGIQSYRGAHGYIEGTCPVSAKGNLGSTGTLLEDSEVTQTPGGMIYASLDKITKSFAISKHVTYLRGDSMRTDSSYTTFSQGYYGGYTGSNNKWRIGAMWFADATAALAGKTIIKAELKMTRASGGWSHAVDVYLGVVKLTQSNYSSTQSPTFVKASSDEYGLAYPIGKLKRETEAVYDVTKLMSAIQSGYALGVYEPKDSYSDGWSPAYTQFYGKGSAYEPVLTVTYKV